MGSLPPSGFEEVVLNSTGKDSNIVPGCVLAAVDSNGMFYQHLQVQLSHLADMSKAKYSTTKPTDTPVSQKMPVQ